MHALIVSLNASIADLEAGPVVYLFDTKKAAVGFAVQKLIDHGDVHRDGETLLSYDRQEVFAGEEEALIDWQDELGATEYFHVCEVKDLR